MNGFSGKATEISADVDQSGKALITRATPNCSDVVWLFDLAVFVDDINKNSLR